jgi:hypothetical protein
MKLDKTKVSKIFAHLKSGSFLCGNSPIKDDRLLYEYVDRNITQLQEYFSYIDIELKLKNQFCYFSSSQSKEQKLQGILELIDIVSFLYDFNSSFDVGFRFTISEIETAIKDDVVLLKKINKIKTLEQDNLSSKIISLINKLEKRGFVALENRYMNRYIVLNSFEYLIGFFDKIEIRS